MSTTTWWRTALSDTLGTVYSAATGKPDPWLTTDLTLQEASGILQAQGIDPNTATDQQWTDAKNQANADVTSTIATAPDISLDCSTPASGLAGLYCSVKKFESMIVMLAILFIVAYLGFKYLERRKLI